MKQYLDLLSHVRDNGVRKPTRAALASTGEHVDALSIFGAQIRFDLAKGFPLVTTKRVPFISMLEELAWFLRGETNVRSLQAKGVTIWDAWCDEDGELGPVYGSQWRGWQCADGRVIDQIANIVDGVREVIANPTASVGRRLIVSAWNVGDIDRMKLPPCHCLAQFSVTEGKLSCQLYQRSADLLLGVPFNIASYALLTHLIAHVTGLGVGEFIHAFGDVHIYANHLDQLDEQLSREPHPLPALAVRPGFFNLAALTRDDVKLLGYTHHAAIKAEVAV